MKRLILSILIAAVLAGCPRKPPTPFETGGGHLVTEVEGWILDNRHAWPISRDDLPYEWVRISGYEPGDPWHEIAG